MSSHRAPAWPAQPATGETGPSGGRTPAPAVLLHRLCGPLQALLARGVARFVDAQLIDLFPSAEEAREGGMISISMNVPVYCPGCTGARHGTGKRAEATEAARDRRGHLPARAVVRGGPSCPRCGGRRVVDELFSAWLALPPGTTDGRILVPSALLPDMVWPIAFRVRL